MASNVQRGPNRMDSSDWIRMKRLGGALGNMTYVAGSRQFENVVNPDPRIEPAVGRYTEFGLSKIQRPASSYTDYVAANTLAYVLQTPANSCGESGAKTLTAHLICRCAPADIVTHNGVCRTCRYDNRVVGTRNT